MSCVEGLSAVKKETNYDADVPETVVLLHGFGGTHRAWDGVIGAAAP